MRQAAGGRRQAAGGRRQAAGDRRPATGSGTLGMLLPERGIARVSAFYRSPVACRLSPVV